MSDNIALAGRIRESLVELEYVVIRTVHLAEKALQKMMMIIGMGWLS